MMKSTRLKRFDYSRQNQAYFLTLRFINSMSNRVVRALYENLLKLFDESGFACDALVVMPDHVHLVIHKHVKSAERLCDLVRVLKSKSLYLLKRADLVERTFWQRGYYEHVIRNEEDWVEKVKYTINNPVKAGLATLPEDYPYLFVSGLIKWSAQSRPLREGKTLPHSCSMDNQTSDLSRVGWGLAPHHNGGDVTGGDKPRRYAVLTNRDFKCSHRRGVNGT